MTTQPNKADAVVEARRALCDAMHAMHADRRIIIDMELAQRLDAAWDRYDASLLSAQQQPARGDGESVVVGPSGMSAEALDAGACWERIPQHPQPDATRGVDVRAAAEKAAENLAIEIHDRFATPQNPVEEIVLRHMQAYDSALVEPLRRELAGIRAKYVGHCEAVGAHPFEEGMELMERGVAKIGELKGKLAGLRERIEIWLITIESHCTCIIEPDERDDVKELVWGIKGCVADIRLALLPSTAT